MGLDFIIGILAGFVAAYLYQRFLIFRKPDIILASQISMKELDKLKGRNRYGFKLQNRGKHQVIDITLKAWLCELKEIEGNKVSKGIYEFEINNSNTRTLAPHGKSEEPWGLNYETVLSAESDRNIIEFLNQPDHAVLVTVRATDAISGTTVVQQKEYSQDCIKKGVFGYIENMTVIEE